MANPEHLEILKQGVGVWNEWRKQNRDQRPDLSEHNFIEAELSDFDLSDADLGFSILKEANLIAADLSRSELWRADLEGAMLRHANLSFAELDRSNLIMADLSGARLRNASLILSNCNSITVTNTDFTGAKLGLTGLGDIDFSRARNLDKVTHEEPSYLSIESVYNSKGKIPEPFLRGCGVPEDFIKMIPSLVSQPFQYYSCFISYSSKDDDFTRRLHADLQAAGVRVWFAPEDLKIGDKIRDRIDQSIRFHDKLLLILSENSIDSQWVEKEVETAFEKERLNPGRTVLFPINLDGAVMETGQAWAADIRRTRHIGDFSRWKEHDAYQKAFDRLMRDLKDTAEREEGA